MFMKKLQDKAKKNHKKTVRGIRKMPTFAMF